MALTEEQIEILSNALIPLFDYLESEVIKDVARRIKKTMTYTRTAELQAMSMRELGYSPARIRKEAMKILNSDATFRKEVAKNTMEYKKEIARLIQDIENKAYIALNDIVATAGDMAWISDLSVWRQANKKLTSNSFLHQLVMAIAKQTKNTLRNITQTTGFKMISGFESTETLYRSELDKAMIKIASGTFNRDKVLADMVHDLAQSGLRTIDFASGRTMQLDTAARVAMRTGFNQLATQVTDENIKRTEVNLVYVSEHWGARNVGTGHQNHEAWQGKVYYIKHIDGYSYAEEAKRVGQSTIEDLWEITGYSIDGAHDSDPLGLHGYNCRHQHHPWFEGISSLPAKNPEPQPVTINGKTYDYYAMTQRMRSMERSVRSLKRERDALKTIGLPLDEINAKIAQKTREYNDFCAAANVNPQKNRLRYENGTADVTKTKAWREYKKSSIKIDLSKKVLGVGDGASDGSNPVFIGQIDVEKTDDAIRYFGEQIRHSDVECVYVIDKYGNVYYNSGTFETVSLGDLDITDCHVLHNHPSSNGIVSFGSDDFSMIQSDAAYAWYLVNEQYNYYVKKIKDMSNLSYSELYRAAMKNIKSSGELQHDVFEMLKSEGYIEYVRTEIDR